MTKMKNRGKMQKTPKSPKQYMDYSFFYKITKSREKEIFAFCVITFEPIKVKTCSAPQNDRLNLSFVKDFYLVAKKMARNGRKMTIYEAKI